MMLSPPPPLTPPPGVFRTTNEVYFGPTFLPDTGVGADTSLKMLRTAICLLAAAPAAAQFGRRNRQQQAEVPSDVDTAMAGWEQLAQNPGQMAELMEGMKVGLRHHRRHTACRPSPVAIAAWPCVAVPTCGSADSGLGMRHAIMPNIIFLLTRTPR